MTLLFVGVALLLFVFGTVALWALYMILKKKDVTSEPVEADENPRQRTMLKKARTACGEIACCKCKHWDLDAGQAAIMQNPNFVQAARQLSPNRMGRRAEDNGPPALPLALDTWELIGACGISSIGVHATDKCESFEKA